MYQAEYAGINAFLVETAKLLLSDGQKRNVRDNVCYELPEPYVFKITNPLAREITIHERGWLKVLPYAESLWIASGRNDMKYITHYLPRMTDFSDDGIYMRGGYGPRIRHYDASIDDCQISDYSIIGQQGLDMFRYIVDSFHEDSNTRRAIISLGDNSKDCFSKDGKVKSTKDIPCTRELHFIKQPSSNKLDLIATMRSNDFIWGASAVNIFNYTFMQEYMAAILGMEVGNYYHIAENFHYYERHSEKVKLLASLDTPIECPSHFGKTFSSLDEFDNLLITLSKEEEKMRNDIQHYYEYQFEDPFFNNWYNVLLQYNKKCHA